MDPMTTPNSTSNSTENISKNALTVNPTTAKLLDLYVDKKRELKKLATFVDELNKQIQNAINLGELDGCIHDNNRYQYGALTITVVQRKSWKYSQAVKDLQEQEQFSGEAEQAISESYRFNIADE
jgi:hypothetical protein